MIDTRVGIVASTNLNRRSYIHDTENGFVFLDRAVAQALHAEAERYWAMSDVDDDPAPNGLPLALFDAVPWLKQFF